MDERAELACSGCGHIEICGPSAMLTWLRKARMVRRDVEPDPDLLLELFRAAANKFSCPKCGAIGLVARPIEEENDEDWGMARKCESCAKPIARERLEVFPNTKLCANCQAGDERGEPAGAVEYCPRCGNVMAMRQSRAGGVTRYVMACSKCRG